MLHDLSFLTGKKTFSHNLSQQIEKQSRFCAYDKSQIQPQSPEFSLQARISWSYY